LDNHKVVTAAKLYHQSSACKMSLLVKINVAVAGITFSLLILRKNVISLVQLESCNSMTKMKMFIYKARW